VTGKSKRLEADGHKVLFEGCFKHEDDKVIEEGFHLGTVLKGTG